MEKILIIEDDLLSQEYMERIFKKEYEIDLCDSSEEYYDKYSEGSYNVIIVDVSIRGSRTGLELIKEIKETPSSANTPIICLTAHAQTRMRQTAIETGVDLFMTKPVPNKTLREAVAFLINERKH